MDQLDDQYFSVPIASTTPYLVVKLAFAPASSSIGIYRAPDPSGTPTCYPVFPTNRQTGWFAPCAFPGPGLLTILWFDENAVFQGSNAYSGFDGTIVGWYLQNPSGIYYSQDARNGGHPQVLTFAGTGAHANEFWECFEGSPYSGGTSTFAEAVLEVDPRGAGGVQLCATPVHGTTWGRLKTTYR